MKRKKVKIDELIPRRITKIYRPAVVTSSESFQTQPAPPSQIAPQSQVVPPSEASPPTGNIIATQEPKERTAALISGIFHDKDIGYHYNAVSNLSEDARYDLLCNF